MTDSQPTILSPCVKNCCLNEHDICLGCFRSLEEICNWARSNYESRQAILANADQRRRVQAVTLSVKPND
ncbi:MAG: DUF1289 domain-containing protein [Methylomonas sp.]